MNPAFSVIILTHNKLAVTRRCLPTLLATRLDESAGPPGDRAPHAPVERMVPSRDRSASPAVGELIVVDNGSTDGTAEWLNAFGTDCAARGVPLHVIRNTENIGCSAARNQGIAAARGEYVVFLDNDVAVRSPGWLATLRQALDTAPRAAFAGPKLVYPYPPYAIQCAGVGISRSGRVQFRGRSQDRLTPAYNQPRDVQCLISACFMTRAALLREYGGFDSAFHPVQYEDFDLCYRLREHGWRALYVPSVEMYHFESTTTAGTNTIPNAYVVIKNGLLFKKRWHHMFATENGPPDNETRWLNVPPTDLDSVTELPLL